MLLKLPALVRYCIEPIQTNPNNQYWNDNKPVLKITLVLTLKGLEFPNTDDPPKRFLNKSKIENKKM